MRTAQVCRPKRSRTGLLNRSALSGALGALLASSAAGANPVGPSAPAGVAHAPTVTTSGSTTSVKLNQSRTIIDWSSFSVNKGETLDFLFGSKSGVVLNRTSGSASINGALNGCVVTCNVIGGSVWIYAPNGVLFGPGARVNVGSLLATTTPLTDVSGFLSGGMNLGFQGGSTARVTAAPGAQLAARGGALALIAPEVDVQAGATLSATGAAVLAAAQNCRIHFDESAGGHLDLMDFEVPTSALRDGTVSATPLSVNGRVSGGSVVLATVSRPSVMNAVISIDGVITATSARTGGGGDILLTASGAASTTKVSGALTASRSVTLQAPDGGALVVSGQVTARDAAGQGGVVVLGGSGTGSATLAATGVLDASSTGAGRLGGKVDATATTLDVEGSVLATGAGGGGAIRLGGGARGQDRTLADATTTTLGAAATVDASATGTGDGGEVTVWSDTDTRFLGAISARGGASGGDGGSAEVSGGYLNFAGGVDLTAARGRMGALLLDPANVEIDPGAKTSDSGDGKTSSSGGSTTYDGFSKISAGEIDATLATTNVEVEASGTIKFDAAAYQFGPAASPASVGAFKLLTFQAGGGFAFGGADTKISASGVNLAFTTPSTLTPSTFDLKGASLATTDGGSISITTPGQLKLSSGSISTAGQGPEPSGALDITASAITLDGTVSAGAGAKRGAVSLAATAGGVTQPATASVQAGLLSVTAVAPTAGAASVALKGAANDVTSFTAVVTPQSLKVASLQSDVTLQDASAGLTVVAPGVSTFLGDVSLTNKGSGSTGAPLTLSGTLSAGQGLLGGGAVSLTAGGALGETTGASVTAPSLTLHAYSGDIGFDLAGANAVGTVALAADGAGSSIRFASTEALTVSTPVTVGGDLALGSGGQLTLSQAPTVGGDYTVTATSFGGQTLSPSLATASDFTVDQTSGDFNLNALGLPTTSPTGRLSVTAAGAISDSATAAVSYGSLALKGSTISAPALVATSGGISLQSTRTTDSGTAISLGGELSATGGVTLSGAGGAITQASGAIIDAGTLSVDAGQGTATLTAANTVGTLARLAGNGGAFTDDVSTLTVQTLAGGAGKLVLRNDGDIAVAGPATGTGGLDVASTADNSQVEFTRAFSLPGDTVVQAGASSALGAVLFDAAVDGGANLTVTGSAVTFASTLGADTALKTLKVTGPAILGGLVSATGDIGLGDVVLAPAGGTVIGLASSTGGVTLGAVSPVSGVTTTSLYVTAPDGAFSAGVLGSAGALAGFGLKAQTASFAATNDVGTLALALTGTGLTAPVSFSDSADTLTIGTVAGPSGATSASLSGIDVGATGALVLSSAGGVTQAAGAITAGTLSVTGYGAVQLAKANSIGALAALDTNGDGDAKVSTTTPLQVTGVVTAGGGALALTGSSLTLGGSSQLTGATVDLNATGGQVSQLQGAIITAGTLTGEATGGINLASTANAISSLESLKVTGEGSLQVTDGVDLTVTGALSTSKAAATDAIVLTAPGVTLASTASLSGGAVALAATSTDGSDGSITDTEGSEIDTADLTASAQLDLDLTSSRNAVAGVGGAGLFAGRTLSLASGAVLTISGPVQGGAGVSLTGAGLSVAKVTSSGDVVLTSTGGGALTLTGVVAADQGAGNVTLSTTSAEPAAQGDIRESGGSIQAGSLDFAGGAVTLTGANAVGALADGSSAQGALQFTDGQSLTVGQISSAKALTLTTTRGDLTFDAPLNAPADVTLTAAGTLTLPLGSIAGDYSVKAAGFAGGALSPRLTGASSSFSVDQTANSLDVSAFGRGLVVPGRLAVIVENGSLTDTAGPPPTLTAGAFLAAAKSTTAGEGDLAIGGLRLTGAGGAVLTASGAVELDGLVSANGGAVTLKAGSTATEGAGGRVTAASTLDAEADGGAVALNGANAVGTLTELSGTAGASYVNGGKAALVVQAAASGDGGLSISTGGDLSLAGAVNSGAFTAMLKAGGVLTQTASAPITAGVLAASGGNGVFLTAASNQVDQVQLGDSSAAGAAFRNTRTTPLTVTSATSTFGAVALSAAGDIVLAGGNAGTSFTASGPGQVQVTGAVAAGTLLTLASTGGMVSETGQGALTAATLSAEGARGVDLTAGYNGVSTLAELQDTGAGDGAGASYAGQLLGAATTVQAAGGAAGPVSLSNPGGLILAGPVTAGSAGGAELITLEASDGAILQTGGQLVAGHLAADARGALKLTSSANSVGQIDGLLAGAGAQLQDGVASLRVVQARSGAGDLILANNGAIELAGAVSAGGPGEPQAISLIAAGGAVSEDAGASLASASLSAQGSGGVMLGRPNAVGVLTLISDTGASGAGVSFDAAGSLTVLSALGGAGGVTLKAGGDLTLSGTGISAPQHAVSLSAKSVTQDTGGQVTAGLLTGSANAGFVLTAASNAVTRIGAISDGRQIALRDTVPLQVSGAIAAPMVSLLDPLNPITQDASSVITTGGLTTSTTGGLSLRGANSLGELVSLTNVGVGGVGVNNASGPLTAAGVDAGTGDLSITTGGALILTGALAAGAAGGTQTASLVAGGAVLQQAGSSLTAGRLTGSAQGGVDLAQPGDAFAALGPLSATGAIILADKVALTIDSAIQAGGALQLSAPALLLSPTGSLAGASVQATASDGAIRLAGDIDSAGAVALAADGGGLTQAAGSISAGSLQGSATGGVTLDTLATSQIVSLSNTGSGDISVQLGGPAVRSGAVTDTAGAITLQQPGGSLAFTSPVQAQGQLTLVAQGSLHGVQATSQAAGVSLSGAGVDFTGSGAGQVSAATDVQVGAGAASAEFHNLASASGDVTVAAGRSDIGVTGSLQVGRDLNLTGASFSGNVLAPSFSASGGRDFLLTDTAGGLDFASLHAPRNLVVAAQDPGAGDSAPLAGGALISDTGSITVTATSLNLSGPLSATAGGVTLSATSGGLQLSGLLDAGQQTAALTASGAVGETGAGAIAAGALTVRAGTGVTLPGPNAVPSVSLANGGAGGVIFNDTVPAVLVEQLTTVSGDLTVDAPDGALTLSGDLSSPGAIMLTAAGPLSGTALSADGGALTAAAQGVVLTGAATGAAGVVLDAGTGGAELQSVTAKAGDLVLRGNAISAGDLLAGGAVTVAGSGPVALGRIQASAGALTLGGSALQFSDASASQGASLTSSGPVGFATLTAAGDVSISTSGALYATTIASTGGGASLSAGALGLATLTTAGAASATTLSGPLALDVLSAGGAATLASAGDAAVRQVQAGGLLTASAAGALSLPAVTAGAAQLSGAMLSLGTLSTSGAASAASTSGDLVLATLKSGGDASLTSAAAVQLGQAEVGGALTGSAAGLFKAATLTVAGGLSLGVGSLDLGATQLGGPAMLTVAGDAALGTFASTGSVQGQVGGALSGQSVRASEGDVMLKAGSLTLASLSASGAVDLATTAGPLALSGLTSGEGATLVTAANASVDQAVVGGGLSFASGGDLTLGTASTGADLTLAAAGALQVGTLAHVGGAASLSGQTVALGTGMVAGGETLRSPGAITLGTLSVGGPLSLAAGAALTADALTSGGDAMLSAGGALQANTVSAGGSASLQAASLALGRVSAGSDAHLQSTGDTTLQTLSAGRDATAASGGGVSVVSVSVGDALSMSVSGLVAVGGVRSGAAGDVSIAGGDLVLGAASGAPTADQVLSTGPATTVELSAVGSLTVSVQGRAALSSVTAGGDVSLAALGGDLSAGVLTGGGAFAASAKGGSADLGVVTLTGAGPAMVAASNDVVLGAGADPAGSTIVLTVPDDLLTVAAGRDVAISYANALSLASVQAGGSVSIASPGSLTLPSLAAGGSASLSAGALQLGTATTGGGFSGLASAGDAVLDAARSGGDLSLVSEAGSAALRTVEMTGAVAGRSTLRVAGAVNASIGASAAGAATGALQLDAPARTLVEVASTGATGGTARVDVTGDARLASISSASGDVVVDATGQVVGAPANGTLVSAAGDLALGAGTSATLGGQSYVGGTATLVAGGPIALDALSAGKATLRADDLTLTGALRATQACSPDCPAPTLVIESRTGSLKVGDTPTGQTFATGGMTLDNGEIGRLQADSVALYAGDTTGSARGDLQVGDVALNASAIRSLSLYTGPQNTVAVLGVVKPTTAGTGVLVIGTPQASAGWTPKSIHVEGQLGASGSTLTVPGAALSSVELNSVQDTLIGGPSFVAAVTRAEGQAGDAINITRGVPVGVQPTVAVLDHNLITAGTLTLRSNGYVVQENTGSVGQQGGILLTNPNRTPYVVTLGRVSASSTGLLTPQLIDLSANYFNASGVLITRQVAAVSTAVDLGDLAPSNAYRINGCTIAIAGSCTPLPNTIVSIRIDKLAEGVQLSTEDPPPVDDPTITATGNDEIWRSGPCEGTACR